MTGRTDNGAAIIPSQNGKVVPFDAIVLLSGCNTGSVEKTLAAIEALHRYSGTPIDQLVSLLHVPMVRATPDDRSCGDRWDSTRWFCEDVAQAVEPELEDILNSKRRLLK